MAKTVKEQKDEKRDGSTPKAKKTKSTTSAAKPAKFEKQVATLKEENAELKDRLLRKAAEFDNYRKRKDVEFSQVIAHANAELLLGLLPVVDDLERSLASGNETADPGSFREGVALICQNLKKVMEGVGLQAIDSVGQPFDPEKHDALMQIESQEYPAGTVVEEHLKGYVLNDRVLRHSQVLVSK